MMGLGRSQRPRQPVDRRADRLVAMSGIGVALVFLCVALASTLLPPTERRGLWLPLHLAMAGGASVAIAAVMPFFSAAIATSQPVSSDVRWASLLAVALGAVGVSIGWVWPSLQLAALSGIVYLTGMGLTAIATLRPLTRGLGPRGDVVTVGYAAALAFVGLGATLATLRLAGVEAVASDWAWLKPTHAWLNLVGFVSLVIATTLLHFLPTVIGARISRSRWAYTCVLGLASGAGLVAIGFAAHWDIAARTGAALSLLGAASLGAYAWTTWRTRARWTGDRGWHLFAMGGLISGIIWFQSSMILAAGSVLLAGADPGLDATVLVAPFAAGWMGLTLLASATHLVPAVGPGGPQAHAAQRVLLGRGARIRLILADLGIGGLIAGDVLDVPPASSTGALLAGLALLATSMLVAVAVARGISDAQRGGTLRASTN